MADLKWHNRYFEKPGNRVADVFVSAQYFEKPGNRVADVFVSAFGVESYLLILFQKAAEVLANRGRDGSKSTTGSNDLEDAETFASSGF